MFRSILRNLNNTVIVNKSKVTLTIPHKPQLIEFLLFSTIEDISDQMKNTGFKQVVFSTINGAKISKSTLMKELKNLAYILNIDEYSFKIIPEPQDEMSNF